METSALAWIGFVVMIVSLFLIPLGLPGVWFMIAILFLGVVGGLVSPWIFFVLLVLAGFAEFLEFVAVGRMTTRYGGTSRTFWGLQRCSRRARSGFAGCRGRKPPRFPASFRR